ncbi:hypothetical protein K402DRAFT_431331 [Aulographum hederae CBS 113979]|uniref:Uncharacterized protein n=1 Tax=Aulographum hederae CBS 113979 TaxID=1176131 RepID=A0A6G1GZH2_9PEZI|nr:hypothetical protein K402DRAFT_431331 [Aulographum hederae CBS 113979]
MPSSLPLHLLILALSLLFTPLASPTSLASPPDPCAILAHYVTQHSHAASESIDYADALVALKCLESVPIDTAGNLELLEELPLFYDWYSFKAYLKSPPPGYLGGAVDIDAELANLKNRLQAGEFTTEWPFQRALQDIFLRAKDFRYGIPSLVSVSRDGKEVPEIYVTADILSNTTASSIPPSPVAKINNLPVVKFLEDLSTSARYHDPDAAFNAQLFSPTNHHVYSFFNTLLPVWPSQRSHVHYSALEFENGTRVYLTNWAALQGDWSGVENGRDYARKFCVDGGFPRGRGSPPYYGPRELQPSPFIESAGREFGGYFISATTTSSSSEEKREKEPNDMPNSDTWNRRSNNNDLAILRLNTFKISDGEAFNKATRLFLAEARRRRSTHLLIDLRSNNGGHSEYADDLLWNVLFPGSHTNLVRRLPAHAAYEQRVRLAGEEWAGRDRDDVERERVRSHREIYAWPIMTRPDGRGFESFDEYYGPYEMYRGANFTAAADQDTSRVHDADGRVSKGGGVDRTAEDLRDVERGPLFEAENIVMLTDGICSSACALFASSLHHTKSIRSIVLGGRLTPTGPMQALGGVKAGPVTLLSHLHSLARHAYSTSSRSPQDAPALQNSALAAFVNASTVLHKSSVGRLNVANFYRGEGLREMPLQFLYEAADCRVWYTGEMVRGVEETWRGVAEAAWGRGGEGRCVEGSVAGPGSVSAARKGGSGR